MATRFKEVMDAHFISTKRLSELTGDTETSIRSLRSRDVSTTSILIKYARAMNVPLWEFFVKPSSIVSYPSTLYDGFDDLFLANKLTALLSERKMPKAQLAKLIDRHPTFVGRILSDGNVTIGTLEMICHALGIEVWELFISREELDKVASGTSTPEPDVVELTDGIYRYGGKTIRLYEGRVVVE